MTNETLLRLIAGSPFECDWNVGSIRAAADRILAAGWRPPPELRAQDEAFRLRGIVALALAASDYGSIREVLWRAFGDAPEPQAGPVTRCNVCGFVIDPRYAAPEVVAQAQRFVESFSHLPKPPQPAMDFARAVVALAARAETAERERDALQRHYDAANRSAGRDPGMSRPLSCYVDDLRVRAATAEAAVKRLTADLLEYGQHQGMCHTKGGRDCNCGWDFIRAALTPAGGDDAG